MLNSSPSSFLTSRRDADPRTRRRRRHARARELGPDGIRPVRERAQPAVRRPRGPGARPSDPALVVDLGCGHGPATLTLAELLAERPGRRASTPPRRCSSRPGCSTPTGGWSGCSPTCASGTPPRSARRPTCIVTNSTLQWVPGHLDLLDALGRGAAPTAAGSPCRCPGNFDAPSHRLMRETAEHHERAGELARGARPAGGRASRPPTCATSSRLGCDVDAWETTYLHVLDPDGEDENPVLTWVAATGAAAGDRHPHRRRRSAARSSSPYAAALADAYPRSSAGVLFPFRRVFAVARQTAAPRADRASTSRPSRNRHLRTRTVPGPGEGSRREARCGQALSVVRVGFASRPVRPFHARLTTCAATSCFLNLRELSHH